MKTVINVLFCLLLCLKLSAQDHVFLETESFSDKGGWVIDQQSFVVQGSSYLMAHGMGRPVKDATTTVNFPKKGKYQIWVRTKDWAPFPKGPGKFQIRLNNQPLPMIFGESGSDEWKWYYGGETNVTTDQVNIALHDLTGFNGRCDAILFTNAPNFTPPNKLEDLNTFRNKILNLTGKTADAGHFDLVVVGGGIAGTCAAISAARMGLKVALIQDRPVLGGNNSSEIRVHLMGDTDKNHYPKLGRIVREMDNGDPGNGNPDAKEYGDARKTAIVKAEHNITLFLNTHVYKVEKDKDKILAVVGRDIATNKEPASKEPISPIALVTEPLATWPVPIIVLAAKVKPKPANRWPPKKLTISHSEPQTCGHHSNATPYRRFPKRPGRFRFPTNTISTSLKLIGNGKRVLEIIIPLLTPKKFGIITCGPSSATGRT